MDAVMMAKGFRIAVAVALTAGLLVACGDGDDSASPTPEPTPSLSASADPSPSPTPTPAASPTATATSEASQPYPEVPLHTGEYTLEEIFNSGEYAYVVVYAEMLGPVPDSAPRVLCTRSGAGYHECQEFTLDDVFVTFEAFVPVGEDFQFGASGSDVVLGGDFHVVGNVSVPPSVGAGEYAYFDIQFDYGSAVAVDGVDVPAMFVK